jgi:hypothetical protein
MDATLNLIAWAGVIAAAALVAALASALLPG